MNQSIVNRFNAAVLSEASKMIEEGVRVEDIDKVWRFHLGILYTLFGPMGNVDYIGLDVVYYASLYLYQRFRDEKFKPSHWLLEKVDKGELGVKTGKGIYEYQDIERAYVERVERIEKMLKFLLK
jgi:3-hydroxyacyl-CoA dehydrogenase